MDKREKWMLIYHARGVVLTLCLAILVHTGLWLAGIVDQVIFTLFIPFAVLYLIYMYFDRQMLIKNPRLVVLAQEEKQTIGFKVDTVVMVIALAGMLLCLFYFRNFFNVVLLAFALYYIISTVIYSVRLLRQ